MAEGAGRFPEAVFLRREDGTGYGFFFKSEADFKRAVESFSKPILRSFQGKPIPNQPDPEQHLRTAIATFVSQAFDRTLPRGVGPEGVSRGVAACVKLNFSVQVPRVVVVERRQGKIAVRPGLEFARHPGHPLAVVVDAATHGGEAQFFATAESYRKAADAPPDARSFLPQIVYRLYSSTPSVMAGKPLRDEGGKASKVEFRALNFGAKVTPVERATRKK